MGEYLPLVSIVIPVYNGSNYMRQAIDSAIAQTYKNIEIIVVNDGSRDDGKTAEIARQYGDRITYLEKPNGGCASALNYGIEHMHGEWFSWLSHDDRYAPQKVERSIKFISDKGIENGQAIVNCGTELIDENGEVIFHPIKEQKGTIQSLDLFKALLFSFSINGCALLIHKDALKTIGEFDTKLTYTPDYDYWLRAAIAGYGLVSFDEKLCYNRVHRAQVSVQQKDKLVPDVKAQIIKMCNLLSDNAHEYNPLYVKYLWIYAYSERYQEETHAVEELFARYGIHAQDIKKEARSISVRKAVKQALKDVYRTLFKKGMD